MPPTYFPIEFYQMENARIILYGDDPLHFSNSRTQTSGIKPSMSSGAS